LVVVEVHQTMCQTPPRQEMADLVEVRLDRMQIVDWVQQVKAIMVRIRAVNGTLAEAAALAQ
jgi:hypothetical protein